VEEAAPAVVDEWNTNDKPKRRGGKDYLLEKAEIKA
jgi:hypothetical protein